MDFGEVIVKAWRITWKHKVLWIFGILAGCARGGGGTGGGSGWRSERPFGSNAGPEIQQQLAGVGDWISSHIWVVVLVVVGLLLLMVLSIFLGTIGRIGLIRGAFKADGGAERLPFGELWRESLPFFWRVFGLSFLVGLAFLIIFLPLVLLGVVTAGVGFLCILPLLCFLVPLAWIVGLVIQQANAAMVIENLSLSAGVRRGWEVVKHNVGPVLIIWLITLVIGLVVGIVIALPVLIVVIPAAIAFAASGAGASYAPLIVGGICMAVYLPVLLIANGILTAYLQSVWALTFVRLTHLPEGKEAPAALPANA